MQPRHGDRPSLPSRLAGPAVLLGLLAIILAAAGLFAGDYLQRILIIIGINTILVVSLNLSNGFTGVFSLGHVGFMAIGAYAAALLTLPVSLKAVNLPSLPAWLGQLALPFLPATLIAGLLAMLVAFLVGLSLMRLKGAYISVATLGFLVIVQVILVNWDQVTRGARTFAGVPPHTSLWNVWVWAVLAVYVVWRVGASAFGREMRAARDDEVAALSLGVSVLRSRLLAFCLSAFLTGVAGSLWAHFITSFSPKSFFFAQAFNVITMLVIGGLGSVSGSVIGVFLITVLSELLRNAERGFDLGIFRLPPLYGASQILMAILFVLVIVFRPAGLLGGREIDVGRVLRRLLRPRGGEGDLLSRAAVPVAEAEAVSLLLNQDQHMKKAYTAKESVVINAPAARVWQALTRPEMVKQYLFGTEMTADWRVGGAITYRGQWQGKAYEDKGSVVEIKPEKRLRSTYFSALSGLEDKPENYSTVTYELAEARGRTTLTVTQDNNPSQESAEHSAKNWALVLDGLKKLLEK